MKWKRPFDVAASSAALVVSSPLLLVAMIAIRLETPGPVIYRQTRVGLNGDEFEMFKLRTMVHGAEHHGAGMAVTRHDDRITRVGALLRKFSIDEFPNFVNVLRGEMSVVGPRPTLPEQVAKYDPTERRRHEVKPGITGLAQVNGRAHLKWSEKIRYDVWYVDHRSAWLDLKILVKTVWLIVTFQGLYTDGMGGWDKE